MTIREATALVLLYRACLTATRTGELRRAARQAVEHVPALTEHAVQVDCHGLLMPPQPTRSSFPFFSHRTMAEVASNEV